MKRPAVFFDRDNTLIACDGYLGDPEKVTLVAGAAEAIARTRALGFATVVVSNQSGVARGLFDEEAVRAVNARLDDLLVAENPAAVIDRHEFCPYHPEAVLDDYRQDSDLRKPKPGMILAAAKAMALELSRSWLVGDAPRDIEAGHAAGCRTILFADPNLPASPAAADEASKIKPEFTAATLKDAVDYIEKQSVAAQPMRLVGAAPASVSSAPSPAPAAAAAPRIAKPAQTNTAAPAKPAATPATPPAAAAAAPPPSKSERTPPNTRLELVAEQILLELRRRNEQAHTDFSVSKLMAGIVQVLVLATLFLGYVRGSATATTLQTYILVALTLQTMTIALLIMSRQK